ncbi:MAG: glycoside hydrolase family 3 protein [Proteiniclasticum sp.]|nr:glycoside hydrolase family 3 protein [Proteiniclasticum sp.]
MEKPWSLKSDDELLNMMTLEEKASLLSGENFWNTKSIERLGIPSIMLTDGPHGLRKQGGKADHLGLHKSRKATCFPTAATLASSWDNKLLYDIGSALGREARREKVSVVLGPGLNLKRNPLGGRNFEYFSEDPLLSGNLAAEMIQGIQSQGVAACPKHYAVNSQETLRMMMNEVVDERALRELYLEGFRRAVKKGDPKTIMTSYNKINGIFANEHPEVLRKILMEEWGFQNVVVTDWGGNNDRVEGLLQGNTLEMPSTNGITDEEIVQAVKKGDLPLYEVDQAVRRILRLLRWTESGPKDHLLTDKDVSNDSIYEAHHKAAIDAAERSMVLLKNEENLLPLSSLETRIALIGDFFEKPRYQGAGSSLINPMNLVSLKEVFEHSQYFITGYEKGFRRMGKVNRSLQERAVHLAKSSDVALVFLGLDESREAEGVDRKNLKLPENQLTLIKEIAKVQKNVVVILAGGAPVELPFDRDVKTILCSYLPGQGGSEALFNVITGKVNPSGKLAETFPLSYESVASGEIYPSTGAYAEHRESIFVGYRQYDTMEMAVAYPFGHGLSYTSFAYSELKVKGLEVELSLENTGERFGEEVVEVYLEAKDPEVFSERKKLAGYTKIGLQPKEKKKVVIHLEEESFTYYHVEEKKFVLQEGRYGVQVGASSRDIRLSQEIEITKVECKKFQVAETAPYKDRALTAYKEGKLLKITKEEFQELLGETLPENRRTVTLPLTPENLIMDSREGGLFGRILYRFILMAHKVLMKLKKPIPGNNVLFVLEMPFRSVARMSGGKVDYGMLDSILLMVNGSFFKGLGRLTKTYIQKRIKEKQKRKLILSLGGKQ